MSTTIQEIQELCEAIQQETQNGSITAARLGSLLILMADKLEENEGSYHKPSGGIPKTDLAAAVRTSLGKADAAYQKPSGGIPYEDMSSAVKTSLDKADTALQQHQSLAGYYQKPSGGIPYEDMSSAVKTSLDKADSALQSHQDISGKATVIDLFNYRDNRVPTPEYLLSDNYIPYYTYGEYPVQMGIVVEPNEESDNDFYYVGRFTSDNGITFGYLSFSNKGDWGFRGGNQGFFTEDNVPEALKQAIYAFGLSREKVMDAQDAAIGGIPLRTVKENGVMVYPVSHSGAIVHDLDAETTVFEEIEALKQGRKVLYVEFWDDENPPMHKDSASVGDLFYKTNTGVLYKAYEDDGVILFGIEPILEGALYIYEYGDFFGIGRVKDNARILHLLHYQTTAEQAYNGLMSAEDKTKLDTIFNYGKAQGWWQ